MEEISCDCSLFSLMRQDSMVDLRDLGRKPRFPCCPASWSASFPSRGSCGPSLATRLCAAVESWPLPKMTGEGRWVGGWVEGAPPGTPLCLRAVCCGLHETPWVP